MAKPMAQKPEVKKIEEMTMCGTMDCDDCKNQLNLCKLCAKKATIEHLCVCSMTAKKACIDQLKAVDLQVQDEKVNTLCVSDKLWAKSVSATSVNATNLCAQNATFDKLCVNQLTTNTFVPYRAAVAFSADALYTLGTNVNWDTIIDDPNGNVALGSFSYTVPVSGYYVLSYYLRADQLTGAFIIAGPPVGLFNVLVNGIELRQLQVPYLSFSALQRGILSSLVLLTAGDVLTMKYDVLVMDPASGLVPYAGTVSIKGSVAEGFSRFEIHYLSSLATQPPPPTCTPCAPVVLPCPDPLVVQCDPNMRCFPGVGMDDDCDSCQK